ncbi:MAG TPA: alpha-L-rhamnosidase N-terminal domain-containing protein, partial [Candidatus Hydrogenedentes bacterium]|nr:alpha-L-rhamnosidase N-terminal domain-containing protein [Candidatus Hydrogenedentota bacterium]
MKKILASAPFLALAPMVAAAALPEWSASWIWHGGSQSPGYNDTIEARTSFVAPEHASATLRITADSYYRVFINGQWVGDGPARSWPSHYQFDVIDVTPFVAMGANEIRVIAKFFGIGTFHQLPVEAGLLAQLDLADSAGQFVLSVGTDQSWATRKADEWVQFAPKQCVQMGPYEIYDARVAGSGTFTPATVKYAANEGPWRDLNERDCALLTLKPVAPRAFVAAQTVKKPAARSYVF